MKWIEKMVERITRSDAPLNNSFRIDRHKIDCQSGMSDYMDVTIDNSHKFSFDFLTKELCRVRDCKYWEYIILSLRDIYGNIKVTDNFKINENEKD